MNLLRRFLLPLAGVAAVLFIISIATPRAVHAITAALVQIVNTPANAVPTVLAPAASQIYQETCSQYMTSGNVGTCYLRAVPAGQTLFIDTLSFYLFTDHGNVAYEVYLAGDRKIWVPLSLPQTSSGLDAYTTTLSVRFTVPQSVQPQCTMYLKNMTAYSAVLCTVSGYLAPSQ